jgi:hypothetical protein
MDAETAVAMEVISAPTPREKTNKNGPTIRMLVFMAVRMRRKAAICNLKKCGRGSIIYLIAFVLVDVDFT